MAQWMVEIIEHGIQAKCYNRDSLDIFLSKNKITKDEYDYLMNKYFNN